MKSHFNFNNQERSGIFFLLLLIVVAQLGYFYLRSIKSAEPSIFKVDDEAQAQIDSLKKQSEETGRKTFPFNPNFISDYKGYTLGMSTEEIDRLHKFRSTNRFVNSEEEFQKVTGVSDSLLQVISPFFKFPKWTGPRREFLGSKNRLRAAEVSKAVIDLNLATTEELRGVKGIGQVLSERIIKFRNRLGGFLVDEQLFDVYGLEPDVAERALESFQVLNPPKIKKININTASTNEIAALVYIQYKLAENIVIYREENGAYQSFDELFNVPGFPVNKIDRLALYLSL